MSNTTTNMILIIEHTPDTTQGKVKQLECACVIAKHGNQTSLTVKAVRNAVTMEPINNKDELPPLDTIREAIQLYHWAESNKEIFTDLLVTNN